ncbi:MAG: matrixin family metalloprotease [Rhodocyclaceae bacterium]|nr:matrixin family metalloprotease [Rhodocyclaceae bacterium]
MNGSYVYYPQKGYIGDDRATLLVNVGGKTVKMEYFFRVMQTIPVGSEDESSVYGEGYCPKKTRVWKISSTIDVNGDTTLIASEFQSPSTGAAAIPAADTAPPPPALVSDFLSSFAGRKSVITISVSDLAGGAIGQTSGHAITLDTTADGHGWFIDHTPADNDEFLPTSNPNEWIAKAGSEAASRMDMLSVLLHEYGHALGFEHSTNAQDFMATTLTPGVRRLPSAEELALMSQLVAEIKTDMAAVSNTPDTPQSPFPTLPLDSILGLALFGRLRGTRYGGVTTAIDSASLIQYDIAANPTFTNSQLQSATGWATTGNVSIANGDAVLTESATTQTRLNQVFVVGPTDRFLEIIGDRPRLSHQFC